MKKTSVIITTYNWPKALAVVLDSLQHQTIKDFEVIIADDGSTPDTRALIEKKQNTVDFVIKHVWQQDQGFRAAKIRNKAVSESEGDYLLFLDGDSVVRNNFIEKHLSLAEQGWFISGNRVLLSESFTKRVLQQQLPVYNWSLWQWLLARIKGDINRWISLLPVNVSFLQKMKKHSWYGAKTCNLSMWKKDFLAVNGFNEAYEGWGYEDSDLVIRLLNHKLLHKSAKFQAPILHLWHADNNREKEQENYQRLLELERSIGKKKDV